MNIASLFAFLLSCLLVVLSAAANDAPHIDKGFEDFQSFYKKSFENSLNPGVIPLKIPISRKSRFTRVKDWNVKNPGSDVNLADQRYPQFQAVVTDLSALGADRPNANAGLFELNKAVIKRYLTGMEHYFEKGIFAARLELADRRVFKSSKKGDLWQVVKKDESGVIRPYSLTTGSYSDQRVVAKPLLYGNPSHTYNLLMPEYVESAKKFNRETFIAPGLHELSSKVYYANVQGVYMRVVPSEKGLRLFNPYNGYYSNQTLEYHPERRMYLFGAAKGYLDKWHVAQIDNDPPEGESGYSGRKILYFLGKKSRTIFREDHKSKTLGIFYNAKTGLLEGFPSDPAAYQGKLGMDALRDEVANNFGVSPDDARRIVQLKFDGLGEAQLDAKTIVLFDYDRLLRSAIAKALISLGYSDVYIRSTLYGDTTLLELGDISTIGDLFKLAVKLSREIANNTDEFKGATPPMHEVNYRLLSTSKLSSDQGKLMDSDSLSLKYLQCRYANMLHGNDWGHISYRLMIPSILTFVGVAYEDNDPTLQAEFMDKLADTLNKKYERSHIYPESRRNITRNDDSPKIKIPGYMITPRDVVHEFTKDMREKLKEKSFFCGKAIATLEARGENYDQSDLDKEVDNAYIKTYQDFANNQGTPSDKAIAEALVPTLEQWEEQKSEAVSAMHSSLLKQQLLASLMIAPNPVGMGIASTYGGVKALEQGDTLIGIAAILGGVGSLIAPVIPISSPLLLAAGVMTVVSGEEVYRATGGTDRLKVGIMALVGTLEGVGGIVMPFAKGMFGAPNTTFALPEGDLTALPEVPSQTNKPQYVIHSDGVTYPELTLEGGRSVRLVKIPGSEIYEARDSVSNKQTGSNYVKNADGSFEKIGLKGGADKNEPAPGTFSQDDKDNLTYADLVFPIKRYPVQGQEMGAVGGELPIPDTEFYRRLSTLQNIDINGIKGDDEEYIELWDDIDDPKHRVANYRHVFDDGWRASYKVTTSKVYSRLGVIGPYEYKLDFHYYPKTDNSPSRILIMDMSTTVQEDKLAPSMGAFFRMKLLRLAKDGYIIDHPDQIAVDWDVAQESSSKDNQYFIELVNMKLRYDEIIKKSTVGKNLNSIVTELGMEKERGFGHTWFGTWDEHDNKVYMIDIKPNTKSDL
ncbi:MAG: hypothetical protein AB2669_19625 [Candidatus Thiodiazotropha endolucinida]